MWGEKTLFRSGDLHIKKWQESAALFEVIFHCLKFENLAEGASELKFYENLALCLGERAG